MVDAMKPNQTKPNITKLAGAVEYTDCTSAEGKTPPMSLLDMKQSDGEVPELWRMWKTPSLPLLPGPLWPGMVTLDNGPIYGLNRTKLHTYAKLNCLN